MSDTVLLTIDWRDVDSDMPEEQQEVLTQTVFQELRALDEVEDIKWECENLISNIGQY